VDDDVIAIIDDDELVRDSVQRLVRSMGFKAEQFSSAGEFLACPSMSKVCCIISDVYMPSGNAGFAHPLARFGHDIPIIFMTARPNRAVEGMLMDAGAVHILSKPFPQNEMALCIALALQRTRSRTKDAVASKA
jgi:FixJ family two-component response regulator